MSTSKQSPEKSPENTLSKQPTAKNSAKPTDSGADLPHNSKKTPLGPNTKR